MSFSWKRAGSARTPKSLLRSASRGARAFQPVLEALEDRRLLSTIFRTFDGTNNNVAHPDWGSANTQLVRIAPAAYADGLSAPAGADRPGAREISNAIVAHEEDDLPIARQLSAYIYVWGQFLDHDIDLTEPPVTGGEAFNVPVPAGDPFFDPNGTGTQTIRLTRSRFDAATGTTTPRQQINQITSWIDASQVYGSDAGRAASLRTIQGGKLKTSPGDLPHTDAQGNFLAGDVRANENIELTSMHALFVREHNRWADRIAGENPGLNDEEIYQRARAIVGAEIQIITYKEFLPALLGANALQPYSGYNPNVNPGIANEFATAAFRLHTLINNDVEFFDNDGRALDEIELREAFNNPDLIRERGIDTILKYVASAQSEEVDNQLVDGLRNFLFGLPGQAGLDLASLNIQRGRDHGLADYNSVRAAYGLPRVNNFNDISSNPDVRRVLRDLYGNVNNIDLWVGALAEDHVPGSSVGPLIRRILANQFERLRDGDRFWYQQVFSGQQLADLERTTLADIIKRNTTVTNLQSNVFFMRAEIRGQVFHDRDADGRLDRNERAVPGALVQLLDDEGEVLASTRTDRDGRYRFTEMTETGDFIVRIVLPPGLAATTGDEHEVLVSRGDVTLTVNFGIHSAHGLEFDDLVSAIRSREER